MLFSVLAASTAVAGDDLVHRAAAVANMSEPFPGKLGVINGRVTTPGEWDGAVMVISGTQCTDSGLCSGTFIHPRVVMTAAHCCGGTRAICSGKTRPGTRIALSIAESRHGFLSNDFCLLHLDQSVNDVPIYEVCDSGPSIGDATIVGYGVSNSGVPQQGAGIQREGLVRITRVNSYDITITGRTSGTYNNACNGDSGGPIFVPTSRGVCVAGACSRGSLYCPANSNGIYTSAVQANNKETVISATKGWGADVTPGSCPVAECCYSRTCQ